MYIEKEFRFEASHILPRHEGKCSRLHGHSWKLVVGVHGGINPNSQFVMDYAELKRVVQPLVDLFDHRHLNCFIRYPSSENVATHVAYQLIGTMEEHNVWKYVVKVSETESTWAVWTSDRVENRERFTGIKDSEWRAPQLFGITDVYKQLSASEMHAAAAFKEFQIHQTEVEQLKMYMASMDFKPELPTKG